MTVIVHILGDADVGLSPRDDRSMVDEVLSGEDIAAKRDLLRGPSRQENHHSAMRPLESVVTHLEFQAPELLRHGTTRVVLMATCQDPPHPRDTEPIARAVVEVLTQQPDSFGVHLVPEVVVVPSMSAEAFARAVATSPAVQASDKVVVGVAGGAVAATIGVLGGLLQAGVVPTLMEANRQDQDLDVNPQLVRLKVDVKSWLARNRQYEALHALINDTDAKALCRALHRATRGEWTMQLPKDLPTDQTIRHLAHALDAPRTNNAILDRPNHAAAFRRWRDAVDRVVVAEVAAQEVSALPMLEIALRCRVNAETEDLGSELAKAAETIRLAALAANLHARAKDVLADTKIQESALRILRDEPTISSDKLADALLETTRSALAEAHRKAAANAAKIDAFDTLFHFDFLNHPDRLPARLRPLLTDNRMRWRKLAVDNRHGLGFSDIAEVREILVAEGVTGGSDLAQAQAVRELGFTPPAPLDASEHLVLVCVGERNTHEHDPMMTAVLAHLGETVDVHVVLLASDGGDRPTLAIAEGMRAWLQTRTRSGAMNVTIAAVGGAEVASVEAARACTDAAVTLIDRQRIVAVDVFTGPGTKAMNLAVCLVGIEQAFALSTPVAVWSLLPGRPAAGGSGASAATTVVVPTLEGLDGWSRLIDDESMVTVLTSALRRLDLGLLSATLQRAPRVWGRVKKSVADLSLLLEASTKRDCPALLAAMKLWGIEGYDQLTSSRLQQIRTLFSPEQRLALARMAVTLSDRFPDSGPKAWSRTGPAATSLWKARIDAIKHPWDQIPESPNLKDLLRDLKLPWSDEWPLAEVVRAIADEIERVAHPRGTYTLANYTPHSVTILSDDGPLSIPVSGPPARVGQTRGDLEPIRVGAFDISVGWSQIGTEVINLPEVRPGQLIIVARMVAEAAADRSDLVFPDDLVRDDNGAVVGCRRLSRLGGAEVEWI